MIELCPLCNRPLGDVRIEQHHLVPVSQGGKQTEAIHSVCHRKIHATFLEKELARDYYTWEALRSHPDIAKFIKWVSRKPSDFYDLSITSKDKRARR